MESASDTINIENLKEHIRILSSDEFEGRSPSSKGEKLTLDYLEKEFTNLGLQPGNGESFLQQVPLVEITSEYDDSLIIRGGDEDLKFQYKKDFMAVSRRMMDSVALTNSELVFAGYGIVAPEYNWDDYENLDVKDKTVIVLINDPGFATEDENLFNGRAMTYYGRWTYKFEEAARQGADGVIIVHETEPAAYPWEVVQNSWTGPQFYLEAEDNNMSRCAVESWITIDTAEKLFQAAGLDFQAQKEASLEKKFQGESLGLSANFGIRNSVENSLSHNFLAVWPGLERPNEYIIYSAHWDHFGKDTSGDKVEIFNGARDNATGVAGLLEVARAYTLLTEQPKRSILFLAVTGEERGLLGSKYYATHPVYPVTKTVAAINMDGLNIWGPTKDVTVVGYGNSELDNYVEDIAAEHDRHVRPDPEPEKGGYYRSDHFSFAQQGIPSLAADHGVEHAEHGEAWMLKTMNQWIEQNYHKPSDEYRPDEWDMTGAIEDLQLLFEVGRRLSMEESFPNWREGTEFRAKRDEDMRQAD